MFCPRARNGRHGIFPCQAGRPANAGSGGNAMTGGDGWRDAGRRNFGRLARRCRWRIACRARGSRYTCRRRWGGSVIGKAQIVSGNSERDKQTNQFYWFHILAGYGLRLIVAASEKNHFQSRHDDEQHHGSNQHAADNHRGQWTLHLAADAGRNRRRE